MAEFGNLSGEVCWRNGCQGVIADHPHPGCSCHISAPCSGCTTPREYCPECNWKAGAFDSEMNGFLIKGNIFGDGPVSWEPRPLDPRKIDYRVRYHTNSSQICEGVYPEGTERSEIEKQVRGTFGGRFETFGGGKFKYIAYTD